MIDSIRRFAPSVIGATAALLVGLMIGSSSATQEAPQAMLDAAASRGQRFDAILYGSEGKRQYLDALKLRMTEMCELLENETDPDRAERYFFLGMTAMMLEKGLVIPGRNQGVQLMGGVEIDLDSFDEGATDWILVAPKVVRILAEDSLLKQQLGAEQELRLPKGRFVKYVTSDGIFDGGIDPADLDRYALFVGLGQQALIVYPNEGVDFPAWVAWVPGKTLADTWERPPLPASVHR